MPEPDETTPKTLPRYAMVTHIFTLCAVVLSKPLYDVLASQPEYFIINRIATGDIYLFVLILSIGIPIAISVFHLIPLKLPLHKQIQSVIVGILLTMFLLQILKHVTILQGFISAVLGLVGGGFSGIHYYRNRQFATGLTCLTPLILIFPILFIFSEGIQRVLHPQESTETLSQHKSPRLAKTPPIVMLVFDEFPLVDLLGATGEIDAKRFPNFAKLANDSGWYSNATTVETRTDRSLPAILTGKYAPENAMPRLEDYPENIFSLLAPYYSLHVKETTTDLNPEKNGEDSMIATDQKSRQIDRVKALLSDMKVVYLHLLMPPAFANSLPSIDEQWGGFENGHTGDAESYKTRKEELETFIDEMKQYPKETFHFLHLIVPHRPHNFLPSGKAYTLDGGYKTGHIKKDKQGRRDELPDVKLPTDRLHQGLLLQIGFVDTMVGKFISTLKEMGIYEESLIVVVADHGISYQSGLAIRTLSTENVGEIGFIPLLIKQPNQMKGFKNRSNVETIDIVPTMVDILAVENEWKFDGRSLIDLNAPARVHKTIIEKPYQAFNFTEKEYRAAKEKALARNIDAFSLNDFRATLFHYGVALNLVGQPKDALNYESIPGTIECATVNDFLNVDLSAPYIQTQLSGSVNMSFEEIPQACVVVCVNGTVQGAARPFEHEGNIQFDLVISDEVFRQGANDVQLLLLRVP